MRTTTRVPRALAAIATIAALAACADGAGTPASPTGPPQASRKPGRAPTVAVTDLGTAIRALAVNASGMIVGSAGGHAAVWWHGHTADLGTLGGAASSATAVNPQGDIAGWSLTTAGEMHAFLWRHGRMQDLGTLGGGYSTAAAVDPSDRVVGTSRTPEGDEHAFLWENDRMQDLGTLGGAYSHATDISPSGDVVGYSQLTPPSHNAHAFLWHRGTMTDIGRDTEIFSEAVGITAAGLLAGIDEPVNGLYRAVLWRRTSVVDSGPLSSHLIVNDVAFDGGIVGFMLTGSGDRAFYWITGQPVILPLLPQVPDSFETLSFADGIDPTGRLIVGLIQPVTASPHAVLWTLSRDGTAGEQGSAGGSVVGGGF